MRQAGDGRVALAALRRRAGLPDARRCGLSVEAVGLREVGTAHRAGAQRSAQGQVAHAGVAGSAGAAALRSWRSGFRVWGGKCLRLSQHWINMKGAAMPASINSMQVVRSIPAFVNLMLSDT